MLAKELYVSVKGYEELCQERAAMLPNFQKLLLVLVMPLEGKCVIEFT